MEKQLLDQNVAAYYIRYHMLEGGMSEHTLFLHLNVIDYIKSVISEPNFSYGAYLIECLKMGLTPARELK